MDSIRKASGFLFYLLGVIVILIVVASRGDYLPESVAPFTHTLDMPLIFIAMVYGGSSLYTSLTKGRSSAPLFFAIAIPLGAIFALLVWFNFALPFPPVF